MKILRANFICNDKIEFDVMIIVMEANCKKEWRTTTKALSDEMERICQQLLSKSYF